MQFWKGRLDIAGGLRLDAYRRIRMKARDPKTRVILFTTQGIDTPETIAFLLTAWQLIRPEENLRLIIKLHPIWDADQSPYADAFSGDARVSIISGSEEPNTLELLTTTDLHLSISSTCHYEACALSVPTVVLPLTTSENMAAMVAAGHALEVHSAGDLAALMNPTAHVPVHPEASSFYFEFGARDNMRRLLDDVLKRRS
jgi:UDP-N-acetylglucosamine 2-epimerase